VQAILSMFKAPGEAGSLPTGQAGGSVGQDLEIQAEVCGLAKGEDRATVVYIS